jgi:hypothetical protein
MTGTSEPGHNHLFELRQGQRYLAKDLFASGLLHFAVLSSRGVAISLALLVVLGRSGWLFDGDVGRELKSALASW